MELYPTLDEFILRNFAVVDDLLNTSGHHPIRVEKLFLKLSTLASELLGGHHFDVELIEKVVDAIDHFDLCTSGLEV